VVTAQDSTAKTTDKTFPDVSFDQTIAASIGFYLPSGVSGTVTFAGTVTGAQCLRGHGTTTASGVVSGASLATPVALHIERIADCADGGADTGSSDGAGAGGAAGAGIGGASMGTGGGPIEGSGGSTGAGGAGAGTGGHIGTGGNTGTGGVIVGTGGHTGTGGNVGTGGGGAGTGGAIGTGGDAGDAGTGPCAGLCANPVQLGSMVPYTGSGLGTTNAYCAEAKPSTSLIGIGCTNLGTRMFTINDQKISTNCLSTIQPPPQRAGGYCFQFSAGTPDYTSLYYY
jgi:hypothetical protein